MPTMLIPTLEYPNPKSPGKEYVLPGAKNGAQSLGLRLAAAHRELYVRPRILEPPPIFSLFNKCIY